MKHFYLIFTGLLLILCTCLLFFIFEQKTIIYPIPGEGTQVKEESDHSQRDAWLEMLHKAAPGTNWQEIEAKNRLDRHNRRKESLDLTKYPARNKTEVIANGELTGEWRERGSQNLAGRTLATVYDKINDWIYLVSAGGNIWRGKRDGSKWEIVNQDLRFHSRSLQMIDHQGQTRLLSLVNKVPFYSDDMGLSWESSQGLNTYDNWGSRKDMCVTKDSQTVFLLVQEWLPGPWRPDVGVYTSNDHGQTYQKLTSFGNVSLNNYTLNVPHNTNDLYVIGTGQNGISNLLKFDYEKERLDTINSFSGFSYHNDNRANLTGTESEDVLYLYTYDEDLQVYRSLDTAATWEAMGILPNKPWEVSMWVSKSDPDFLLYGNIECYRTGNGGKDWTKINDWGAYYGDVENKLHADMMYFNEFVTNDGTDFILISNDGGINISYDKLNTTPNIGLKHLNVSQYYDVATDPVGGLTIFAGSQDQGFQRGGAFSDLVVMDFEQVISGDYGHIVFSNDGYHLWVVYPGGWVTYYDDPIFGYLKYSWELESENESVWIPPLMSSPDPSEDAIYMAGGNINGGPGSHIIRLEATAGGIDTSQFAFDFKADGGGEISALAISPLDPSRWYVATTNGLFYFSEDGGLTWDVSAQVGPNPQYLYGSCIYPSKLDKDVVYFAGSGYSTFPVYRSDDGGRFFTEISDGLPKTVVIEITANEDESLFFAATEAGPYVYVLEEEKWYDMSGLAAPAQTYWSVEYLEEREIVRYGTYGRGIWDFKIQPDITSTNELASTSSNWTAFPNPVRDFVRISNNDKEKIDGEYKLVDLNGHVVNSGVIRSTVRDIPMGDVPAGLYHLLVFYEGGSQVLKVVKQ